MCERGVRISSAHARLTGLTTSNGGSDNVRQRLRHTAPGLLFGQILFVRLQLVCLLIHIIIKEYLFHVATFGKMPREPRCARQAPGNVWQGSTDANASIQNAARAVIVDGPLCAGLPPQRKVGRNVRHEVRRAHGNLILATFLDSCAHVMLWSLFCFFRRAKLVNGQASIHLTRCLRTLRARLLRSHTVAARGAREGPWSAFTKSIAYKLSRDFSFSSFLGA